MINKDDIHAMAPETRVLDLTRQDWREHLDKVVRLSGVGTRVVYWEGPTDVDPTGKRAEVFEVMHEYSKGKKVHLCQRRIEGGYAYEAEVR